MLSAMNMHKRSFIKLLLKIINSALVQLVHIIAYTHSCGIVMHLLDETIVTLGGVVMEGSNIPHLK